MQASKPSVPSVSSGLRRSSPAAVHDASDDGLITTAVSISKPSTSSKVAAQRVANLPRIPANCATEVQSTVRPLVPEKKKPKPVPAYSSSSSSAHATSITQPTALKDCQKPMDPTDPPTISEGELSADDAHAVSSQVPTLDPLTQQILEQPGGLTAFLEQCREEITASSSSSTSSVREVAESDPNERDPHVDESTNEVEPSREAAAKQVSEAQASSLDPTGKSSPQHEEQEETVSTQQNNSAPLSAVMKMSTSDEKKLSSTSGIGPAPQNIKLLLIDPLFIRELEEHAFHSIADFAQARMSKEDIRLLIASIAESHKLGKTKTIVAILRLNAALEEYQDQQGKR